MELWIDGCKFQQSINPTILVYPDWELNIEFNSDLVIQFQIKTHT